ncbi:protein TASOR 2 isoform X1 [Pleurodeles waltl]|uniref:protein TASOR 2 isoform X1 n=1 Tax=Pleurodeles waltl TaxID=8319 RepID=UPI003709680B
MTKAGIDSRTKRGPTGSSGGGRSMRGNEEEEDTVATSSSVFQEVGPDSHPTFDAIHSLLQSNFLVPASKNCFQYSQAHVVTNETFTKEFKMFAQQKKQSGYTEEELKESFAFLLFDSENDAMVVCKNGLRVGNSSITTLGDPKAGVYVSKYADYLHPRPWYQGKAGYIVIFKLLKGKVKVVPENYTTNYTVPSPGYDCHMSAKNSKVSVKTSHFQAFELNQYYVYELQKDSFVKRPRQVCPYVILAFQYNEPLQTNQTTGASSDKHRITRNTEECYSVWSGQLLILGRPLCDIVFKSPHGAFLPAQLSDTLEIKDIMNISDLKKMLPEDIFNKCNYTDKEVNFEGIYSSLYDVVTSSSVEEKLQKLKEYMKKKELAIVKFLRDQGFLILITSTVLKPNQDLGTDGPINLHALFLFPSSRITCLTTGSSINDMEDVNIGKRGNKMSATVTSLLPALKYALRQAKEAQLAESIHRGAQVEEYFQEFVRLRKDALSPSDPQSTSSSTTSSPLYFDMWTDFPTPEVCSQLGFSQLGTYISNSSIYALQISKAVELFARCSVSTYSFPNQSPKIDVSSLTPQETVEDNMEVGVVQINGTHEQNVVTESSCAKRTKENKSLKKAKSKKKLRRAILSAKKRKKSAPKTVIPITKKVVSLRRTTRVVPEPKRPPSREQAGVHGKSETTLKLASASFPQRRKRGAEVLTAEVVHKTESDPSNKAAVSQEETEAVLQEKKGTQMQEDASSEPNVKRSKRLMSIPSKSIPFRKEANKKLQKRNVVMGKTEERGKLAAQKESRLVKKFHEKQWASGHKPLNKKAALIAKAALENGDSLSKTIEAVVKSSVEREAFKKSLPDELLAGAEDVSALAQRLNVYESHALNLLADLALSSGSAYGAATFGEDLSIEEQQALLGEKLARSVSDHEYSRATKLPKCSSPILSSLCKSPQVTNLELENNTTAEEIHSRQGSTRGHVFFSKVHPDTASPKKVALEHSYASSTAEHARRGQLLKGVPPSNTRNRGKGWQEGAPIGRVLPFRPQEDTTSSPKESEFLTEKRKRGIIGQYKGFICPRTVFRRYGKVKVTFNWEEDYLFHGDSKYTSDPLEKTINRALHGPWDSDIPNHVEDVKLILHMWIALFYSKPSKLLNTAARKVVEHNNPAKYVSINSTLDSFELFEDGNESEKPNVGFADSPSEVEAIAQEPTYSKKSCDIPISSSHISSNEPSSTSSLTARSQHEDNSMPDEGQHCVSSSGYFDTSCTNYMLEPEPVQEICISESQMHEEEGERNELLDSEIIEIDDNDASREDFIESEPFEEITSSVTQVEESEMDREYLIVPKTVADICASVPQVNVHGFEREELLKSVTVVEICSNVPQVEREELLESENDVDVSTNESQVDEHEAEREEFVEPEIVEESCGSSVTQGNETHAVVEEVFEHLAVEAVCNNVPQVEENEIGKEVLCEPEHFVEICTSTSQVNDRFPEKDTVSEPETVVEACTTAPQVDENPIEGFMEPVSVVEVCSSDSQDNENENESEEVKEPESVVEVCSSATQVPCPILVSSFPEMQCRALKKYIIAQKRGGQLTEWSTQLYNMVEGTPAARKELRRPPTVVDLTSSNIPQVFQVTESVSGRDNITETESIVQICNGPPKITDNQRFRIHVDPFVEVGEPKTIREEMVEFGAVEEVCSTDTQVTENVTEEVVESEVVTDICGSFSYDNCYNSAVAHENHSTSFRQDDANCTLVNEGPVFKDRTSTAVETSEHMDSAQPVVYYETVVSENDNSLGDVFMTLDDKEDYETPLNEIVTSQKEYAVSHVQSDMIDYNHLNMRNSECTSVSAKESMIYGSSYSNNASPIPLRSENQRSDNQNESVIDHHARSGSQVSNIHNRGFNSFLGMEYSEAKSSGEIRVEKSPSAGWVVYKHFSLQRNNLPPMHQSSYVGGQKDVLGPEHEENMCCVTEEASAADLPDSAKNDEHEECVLYFDNIVDISPASTPDEKPVGDITDKFEREFVDELIVTETSQTTKEETFCPSPKSASNFPLADPCTDTDNHTDDRSSASTAVPIEDVLKGVSGGQSSDHHCSQHLADISIDSIPECSTVELSTASASRRDDVTPRTRLKKHNYNNIECETGDCRCGQDSVHEGKWTPHLKCNQKNLVKHERYRMSRTYRNFSVTKDVKETRIAVRGFPRDHSFSERSDFLSSWTNRCIVRDVTRSTLDLEYLRFIHNMNQVIKSQTCYSPTSEERLSSRKTQEARCRSPLVITVLCPEQRRGATNRRAGCYIQDEYEASSLKPGFSEQVPGSIYTKKHRPRTREQATPFHFNRLSYKSKAVENVDPSPRTSDCLQSSNVLLGNNASGNTLRDQSTVPDQERPTSEQERAPVSQKEIPTSVSQEPVFLENIITSLCSNIASRLNSVASEACKMLLAFYIIEIEPEPYFSEIKAMLKLDGYSEMEPLQFFQADRTEDSVLTIIMRNEDIAVHAQEIPDLLQLKMLPSVTFAGVDSPEDITDGTYQKLFHSGGFVVSDETVLENVTLGELQDILKLLEKLNRHERWKWLLHYRERKKMKEEARVNYIAKKKELMLKSYQESNIVEVLHYHQCDSKSPPKFEDLACLLNLLIQNISSRFAIFLTEKPSIVKETCTKHGIVVVDVNTFIETVQKMTVPFNI